MGELRGAHIGGARSVRHRNRPGLSRTASKDFPIPSVHFGQRHRSREAVERLASLAGGGRAGCTGVGIGWARLHRPVPIVFAGGFRLAGGREAGSKEPPSWVERG